jgi:hypothetical protein
MREDVYYEDRQLRHRGDRVAAGVAVVLALAFTVGTSWWVSNRAAVQNPGGLLGGQATADTATQGKAALPGPAPAAPGEIYNGQAVGTTTTGVVTQLDQSRRTLTLDNGQTYGLADNLPVDNVQQGARVTITYNASNNQNVVTRIQPAFNGNGQTGGPAPNDAPPANQTRGLVP